MAILDTYRAQSFPRKVLIIVIILLVILLLLWGIFSLVTGPDEEAQEQQQQQQEEQQEPATQPPLDVSNTFVQPNELAVQEQMQVEQAQIPATLVAQSFVERFGSYNNQGNFSNFDDLSFFMTASLENWVQNSYIPQLRGELPGFDEFYAINTKAISTEVLNLTDGGEATVMVTTQRQEVGENGNQTNVLYQDARVELRLIENQWKVNAVYWQ